MTLFNLEDINSIVLSGGGLLGISYIGLFQYLEEHQAISKINTITGCSAGALFGTLLAIGYSSSEIYNIVKTMNFKEYIKINVDSLLNFLRVKGFDSGQTLMTFIKKIISDKTGKEDITFNDIFEKYGKILKIGITNLTTSKFQLIDYTTHPDIPIYQAINASIAIPFIFEPVIMNGEIYCDGGLLDNLPIEYILPAEGTKSDNKQESKSVNILGIYLTNNIDCLTADNYLQANFYQYLNSVLHASFIHPTLCKKSQENNKNYKIIIIEIPCDIMTFLKLNASHDDIDNIITIAYDTIKNECSA